MFSIGSNLAGFFHDQATGMSFNLGLGSIGQNFNVGSNVGDSERRQRTSALQPRQRRPRQLSGETRAPQTSAANLGNHGIHFGSLSGYGFGFGNAGDFQPGLRQRKTANNIGFASTGDSIGIRGLSATDQQD